MESVMPIFIAVTKFNENYEFGRLIVEAPSLEEVQSVALSCVDMLARTYCCDGEIEAATEESRETPSPYYSQDSLERLRKEIAADILAAKWRKINCAAYSISGCS